uniref:hypothetical protein n=1 Tax=Eisenbergiella tayi TaxID=1432052 RepID=UPI003FD886B9
SNLSVKEISEKYGYANQYFFSTSVKKEKGIFLSSFGKGKYLPLNYSCYSLLYRYPIYLNSSLHPYLST